MPTRAVLNVTIRGSCEINRQVTANVKGKAIILQAWTGHEGSRRLRLLDLETVGT